MPWLAVIVLLAAPTVGGLIQVALSRAREFDADLGAAMLTGDPDGLAAALARLERAQGRLWESIFLPGGRTPDPSVLRTHPLTAERVARLMALKAAPGGPDGSGLPLALEPRPSMIPKIRPHSGPHFPHGAAGVHSLMADAGAQGDTIDDSFPACNVPLNPPQGDPRLRLTRGGVWW